MSAAVEESRFIRSACTQVVASDAHSTVLAHLLSGRKYALGPDAFHLLTSMGEPTTLSRLRELLPHVDPARLSAAIEQLERQELIVRCDDAAVDESFQVTALTRTLCNIDAFTPAGAGPPRVVFLGVPYGHGNAISSATERFPGEVRKYSGRIHADLKKTHFTGSDGHIFDADTEVDLANLRQLVDGGRLADWGNLFIHPQEYAQHVYRNVEKGVAMLLDRNHLPFVLGGDHSITLPVLRALNDRFRRLHVLHLDAHTDTYDSPLDRVFAERSTHGHGNFASHAFALHNVEVVHQFGIRGVNNFGVSTHAKQRIHWIQETRQLAAGRRAPDLPEDVPWYVTIDIDVLDPSVAPGTASPVPGGLSIPELLQLLAILVRGKQVVGVDLVEINPERDRDSLTVQIGLEAILFILNMLQPAAA